MAPLWVMTLLLVIFPSSLSVNLNQLSFIVSRLRNAYTPTYQDGTVTRFPMFSLAVSIPVNSNQNTQQYYDIDKVFQDDPPNNVKNAMTSCKVYSGTRVVAATVLRYPNSINQCPNARVEWDYVRNLNNCPAVQNWADFNDGNKCPADKIENLINTGNKLADHAEWRVLSRFTTAFNTVKKNTDLMLFYVLKSPCGNRCLNPNSWFNILTGISDMKLWTNYAFVFSDVFVPFGHTGDTTGLQTVAKNALVTLGSNIGLKNIYRCSNNLCVCCFYHGAQDQFNDQCVSP